MPGIFQMSLKIPDDMRQQVETIALDERRSRNAQIVKIIEEWLDHNSAENTPSVPAAN